MKLKIEGKLRDGFFEWFKKRYHHSWELSWYVFPQSAQFGLLQEYAECILDRPVFLKWIEDFVIYYKLHNYDMPLTRVEAIEKLNEIVNHD